MIYGTERVVVSISIQFKVTTSLHRVAKLKHYGLFLGKFNWHMGVYAPTTEKTFKNVKKKIKKKLARMSQYSICTRQSFVKN
jgi:hypothetical protein